MSERKINRFELASEISEKMLAGKRLSAPSEEDSHLWRMCIDVDTNKPIWIDKEMSDEFQRLRLSEDENVENKNLVDPCELNGEEQEQFFDKLGAMLRQPSAIEDAFFVELNLKGEGVGIDDAGNML